MYVVDAVRTPVGRIGGGLAQRAPRRPGAAAVRGLLDRVPRPRPRRIDDVHLGNGNGAGEENRNVARMAALLAGLPTSVPGVTENRLCGSGLEAGRGRQPRDRRRRRRACLAGGVESMSRAPWVVAKPEAGYERGDATMHSTTLGWRLVNPRMPERVDRAAGRGGRDPGRALRDRPGGPGRLRPAQPPAGRRGLAARPLRRRGGAVPGADLDRDESVRATPASTRLARLRPVFRAGGTVTAGNSSPMNDGAAALLLAGERRPPSAGRPAAGPHRGRAVSAVEPHLYGIGPVEAAEALKRAGIGWADLAVVELNEAFAAQALACLAEWPELDRRSSTPTAAPSPSATRSGARAPAS